MSCKKKKKKKTNKKVFIRNSHPSHKNIFKCFIGEKLKF